MKRNILFLLIMLVAGVAFGQKKPKINKALKAVQDGELAEAREIIDAAIEHPKTKDDPETWYYRGLIYAAIDTTSKPEYQDVQPDPLITSVEAFNKAEEMNTKEKELFISGPTGLPILKSQHEQMLWAHYLNEGVKAFQEGEQLSAAKAFERCQMVMPKDTTCAFYSGLAYQGAEQFEKAAEKFEYLIEELDHHEKDVYNSLIYIEANIRKDDEKALEYIRKARERWPNEMDLAKTEINTLIRLERVEEAKAELEAAIEAEPDNPDLYFSLGVMLQELENPEEAVAAYERAIEADPNHFNSLFNLAVIHFNNAVEVIKEKNNLGFSKADQKKEKELTKQANELLKKALPYWEKVLELDPKNRTALEQLRFSYAQLRMPEKVQEMQDKMEEYGYTEQG
ncbi:MAG: tetratricopeptide repeat protein [Candidatus Cyclobacteriaceae bacterium M2_1C_046]